MASIIFSEMKPCSEVETGRRLACLSRVTAEAVKAMSHVVVDCMLGLLRTARKNSCDRVTVRSVGVTPRIC